MISLCVGSELGWLEWGWLMGLGDAVMMGLGMGWGGFGENGWLGKEK